MAEELRYPIQVNIPDEKIIDINIIHEEYDKIQRMMEKLNSKAVRTIQNENGDFVTISGFLSPNDVVKKRKLQAEFHKMIVEQAKWIRNQFINEEDAWDVMTNFVNALRMEYEKAVEIFDFSFC